MKELTFQKMNVDKPREKKKLAHLADIDLPKVDGGLVTVLLGSDVFDLIVHMKVRTAPKDINPALHVRTKSSVEPQPCTYLVPRSNQITSLKFTFPIPIYTLTPTISGVVGTPNDLHTIMTESNTKEVGERYIRNWNE